MPTDKELEQIADDVFYNNRYLHWFDLYNPDVQEWIGLSAEAYATKKASLDLLERKLNRRRQQHITVLKKHCSLGVDQLFNFDGTHRYENLGNSEALIKELEDTRTQLSNAIEAIKQLSSPA